MSDARVLFDLFGHGVLADDIAGQCGIERGRVLVRRFPDEETYVRYESDVNGREVLILANLSRPDPHVPALLFAAATARELGARRVTLVAPYLPYMRQDHRFITGEAITSRIFARLVCTHFDALVTMDPHLHRYGALEEIYSVPVRLAASAPAVAQWVLRHVEQPLLMGPDAESEQWVSAVAKLAGAPWCVSQKTRNGDRDVAVSVPDLSAWCGRTPVILDDIISSGRTMLEAVRRVRAAQTPAPVCIGVHAVFADDVQQTLLDAGARAVVTTDTLPHTTNGIAIGPILAETIRPSA